MKILVTGGAGFIGSAVVRLAIARGIERQGLQVGSPDEIAYKLKWITKGQLAKNAQVFGKNIYGQYLQDL